MRVLPDILGIPRHDWQLGILICKLFVNYLELPGNTRNNPRVKKIPENTRSYILTLLPDPNPTRYPVFFPIPDPILKNPARWTLPGGSHIHNAYCLFSRKKNISSLRIVKIICFTKLSTFFISYKEALMNFPCCDLIYWDSALFYRTCWPPVPDCQK